MHQQPLGTKVKATPRWPLLRVWVGLIAVLIGLRLWRVLLTYPFGGVASFCDLGADSPPCHRTVVQLIIADGVSVPVIFLLVLITAGMFVVKLRPNVARWHAGSWRIVWILTIVLMAAMSTSNDKPTDFLALAPVLVFGSFSVLSDDWTSGGGIAELSRAHLLFGAAVVAGIFLAAVVTPLYISWIWLGARERRAG